MKKPMRKTKILYKSSYSFTGRPAEPVELREVIVGELNKQCNGEGELEGMRSDINGLKETVACLVTLLYAKRKLSLAEVKELICGKYGSETFEALKED